MLSLFNTSSDKAGFRLQYMEVYNWGTFDNQIFKIAPLSNNSLLTGANGSGKTTFIDALLTLLVPSKKDRFYNQSSGVEKKGDRSEESYVLGHYGDIQKEGDSKTTTQMLRDKGSYSVLLACFTNTDQKTVTLFQVRWFANGALKRAFGIAHRPLDIETDFSNFDSKRGWKKRLEKIYNSNRLKKVLEFFEGPTKYADRMVDLFGMKSINALSLFNQVVGIKVLGDLDEFIRTNMLEWRDAETEYIQLKESFVTLMDAKNNIDKTKEQIKQLEPINKMANDLQGFDENLFKYEAEKQLGVYWFANKGKELAEKEIKTLNAELLHSENKIKKLKETESELKEKETDLSIQIKSDAVGKQIAEFEKDIGRIEKQRDGRKQKLEIYNALAEKLGLYINPTEEIFYESREVAKTKKDGGKGIQDVLREELRQVRNVEENLEANIKTGIETVLALQENKNNISGRFAQIREDILKEVEARKEEIPFVGELIKVDEKETEWEAGIERVLHNFALHLIVPDKYYFQVNEYVNSTDLKGRIMYHRYKKYNSLKSMQANDFKYNALINKINFKPDNQYVDWVEDKIIQEFNYLCADNLEEFNNQDIAITKEGLIKFGKGRHEKNDIHPVVNKENFILGWDNKDKLEWWKTEMKQFQTEQVEIKKSVLSISKSIGTAEESQERYSDLVKLFETFDDIDWQTYANKIQIMKDSKATLEAANDKVKALQEQLVIVKNNMTANEKLIDKEKETRTKVKNLHESAVEKLNIQDGLLKTVANADLNLEAFQSENEQLANITFADFDKIRFAFQKDNTNNIEKLTAKKAKLKERLIPKISAFKNPSESISSKYKSWRSEVSALPEKVEFISKYQEKYKILVEDGLVEFEKRFNKYLEDTITDRVGGFNMFFEQWGDDIKKNIDSLNYALKEIEFNQDPKTYIQLVAQPKTTDAITEFQRLLHNAIPNFAEIESTEDGKRIHFENHIEPFIKRLKDEKWRNKVLEVRSWFEYKAEEYFSETDQKSKTYSGMGQLSGGEKAQLTYTILGSAIAYQFGLTKEGLESNSFRFIAIDEAFKAQDEDKALYLLNLCKQLHLQLLVVTPSDNIHIVEPHISFVHFVERRNNKNSWLYDMPVEQFQEKREKYVVEV